jgi:sugar/nucleoside kinase (ribokinase family)
VDTAGLVRKPGRTFRWKGRYEFDLNTAHTLDTQLNVFADFQPDLPSAWRDTEYVFLGNIDPDLQRAVLDQVRGPRFVACDTMNFWITSKRDSLLQTLKRVDLLFVNDAEARQLSGEHNIVKAARRILTFGPRAVVIKRGEYGALYFSGEEVFSASAYPLPGVFDPTGAGDSFAGGSWATWPAAAARPQVMRRALVVGSVLAQLRRGSAWTGCGPSPAPRSGGATPRPGGWPTSTTSRWTCSARGVDGRFGPRLPSVT